MSLVPPDNLGQDLEIELIGVLAPHVRERFFVDVGAEKGRFAAAMFASGMRGALNSEPWPQSCCSTKVRTSKPASGSTSSSFIHHAGYSATSAQQAATSTSVDSTCHSERHAFARRNGSVARSSAQSGAACAGESGGMD